MLEFLPYKVKEGLKHVNVGKVYELRLRADKPVIINFNGTYRYLGYYGIADRMENAIRLERNEIADCVYRAGKCSVYAMEEQIKKGFITAEHGERVGLAGEYVFENGKPLTIRNFSSICIRVPHDVLNCGQTIYQICMSDKIRSVLIISPPGLGKTTILRDLSRILAEKTLKNILICDERGEISVGNVGMTCDVLKYCNKSTAFEAGIRALRPDIIITDELSLEDAEPVRRAIFSGIKVIASAHFSTFENILQEYKNTFDYFVVLNGSVIGQIAGIYDDKGQTVL